MGVDKNLGRARPKRKLNSSKKQTRLHIQIYGVVQGVGFRPFIYRLAKSKHLNGWVINSLQGVTIEVEGPKQQLDSFINQIEKQKPPQSSIHSIETSWLYPIGFSGFEIRSSETSGKITALVLPDIATCSKCIAEIFDPGNRRFGYPFTNCTNCGPRFSIIEALPYDRPNTSMKNFKMCNNCQREYHDPLNRRFHAQPNACPQCGPHLELWDQRGHLLFTHNEAISRAARAILDGKIIALKGLGGFQLIVNTQNNGSVKRLRERKHREEKPFALMYPTLQQINSHCFVSALEERLLTSSASPIVLLERRNKSNKEIAKAVVLQNPNLGIMLPYTPLHHLLVDKLKVPVVATSGNLADEPICVDEHEALERLGDIADLFLVHNRPIIRHVDDSIVRTMSDREIVLRRARGYAPLPIQIKEKIKPTLASGAHLKNTVALSVEDRVFISQHIGDLETDAAYRAFEEVIESFQSLYKTKPQKAAADAHPDYLSSQYVNHLKVPKFKVQHHLAHVFSCMLENDLDPPVLGVSWDGTGYGLDKKVWGGEFFLVTKDSAHRVGHFREFPLPGGELAIKEPRRAALGLLCQMQNNPVLKPASLPTFKAFSGEEIRILQKMIQSNINTPFTSSAGRLFDVVVSIIGLRQINKFEGQAAMELEFRANSLITEEDYDLSIYEEAENGTKKYIIDWELMFGELISDYHQNTSASIIAAKFHNSLSNVILEFEQKMAVPKIVLSGGCFQNKYLTEMSIKKLRSGSFDVYWHQRVPPNDGGISLGQIALANKKNDFFKG
jgi:hydrogenase maturation protein HypF